MDKRRSSSKRNGGARLFLVMLVWSAAWPDIFASITLSHADALQIGDKIWQNECHGTIAGLTSWNQGENFASLGIGHFIWYPKGVNGPFEESFPNLVNFISARGVKLPVMLTSTGELDCPWSSRLEFLRAQQTPQMKQLRQFLADTVNLQAEFLVARLQAALPKMLDEAKPADRARVEANFNRVAASPNGRYALVDYVNFKGEGVLHTERYNNEGWGLVQVLEQMRPNQSHPVKEFSKAAAVVLRRRVENSPPARHEAQWLPGWLARVDSYNHD